MKHLAGGLLIPLLLLAATGAVTTAEAQFSVRPAALQLGGADRPGEASIQLRNEGDAPLEFRVYLADYEQASGGGHDFYAAGTLENSCAARLQVSPAQVALLPGEAQEIRVRLAPGSATCWSLVFVESSAVGVTDIRVAQRVGVKTFGMADAAVREGEVSRVSVSSTSEQTEIAIAFENLGNVPILPAGTVEIRTPGGEVIARVAVQSFSVLPGREREVRVALEERLPAGQYLAVPVLDFGGDYLAAGQTAFRVQ